MSDLYLPNDTYDALVSSLAARLPEEDDSQPLMSQHDRAAMTLADAGIWSMRVHADLVRMGETITATAPAIAAPRITRRGRLNLLLRAARSLRHVPGPKLGAMIALAVITSPNSFWLEQLAVFVR